VSDGFAVRLDGFVVGSGGSRRACALVFCNHNVGVLIPYVNRRRNVQLRQPGCG
jgi:hypothetical protein